MTDLFGGKSFSSMVNEILSEVRMIAPDIGARVLPKKDYPKYKKWKEEGEDPKKIPYSMDTYMVKGWKCPTPPPDKDSIEGILWDTSSEVERLRPCTRKEATHISARGVGGLIRPVEDVVVVGRSIQPEMIKNLKNAHMRRIKRYMEYGY